MTVDYTDIFARRQTGGFDQGLRDFMLRVYNFMGLGLLVTAITAYLVLNVPAIGSLVFVMTPQGVVTGQTTLGSFLPLISLGMVLYFSSTIMSMKPSTATTCFFAFAVLKGFWIAPYALIYTNESLASTFFVCASMFGLTSLYGYTTKRDIAGLGGFLVMGLFGLIAAQLINVFFVQNWFTHMALSAIGIVIFIGLTAWETQRLKSIYFHTGGGQAAQNYAIVGAFSLYLNFINMFIMLLQFLGNRRN